MSKAKYKTPYADYLPPLSKAEYAALEADIKANGVRDAVLLDDEGNVLDGHHRLEIEPNAPTRVISGLSQLEKEAFAIRVNDNRRNMSSEQRKEVANRKKHIALRMKKAGKREEDIGVALGVAQNTVSSWLGKIRNITPDIANVPDLRVKVPPPVRAEIIERVEAGEPQKDVAADFKLSPSRVSQIYGAHCGVQESVIQRQAKAKEIEDTLGNEDHGVLIGDFREVSKSLPDKSVDLIFTDPPYDHKSLPMYRDLGNVAARVLIDGGSLITFGNTLYIPSMIQQIEAAGLHYLWTLACVHTGKKARMTEYGIVVNWKPMLWFVKGTNRHDTQTFVDDMVQSERAKSHHEWQQGTIEANYYIEKLTRPGTMVFDPFCGGGTTAVAAKQLGRKWITCDVHEEHALIARGRVAETEVAGPVSQSA